MAQHKKIVYIVKDCIEIDETQSLKNCVQDAITHMTLLFTERGEVFDGIFIKMPDKTGYIWKNV